MISFCGIDIKTSEAVPKGTILLIEPRWGCCPKCGWAAKQDICEKCHWPGGMLRAVITNLKVPEGY
jgi:hypothetical protein